MRALRPGNGVIPRGFADSRRTDARLYRQYCLNVQTAWGPLPAVALPVLREAGRAEVELQRLGADLEAARRRHRTRDAARIRKQQFMLREQHARLERRLQELGAAQPRDPLAAVRKAVAEANAK